jgi:hypothetical protein
MYQKLISAIVVATIAVGSLSLSADEVAYSIESPSDSIRLKPQARKFLEKKPEDLQVTAKLDGTKQFFGQFRYGSSDSAMVAVVVDQIGEATDEFHLYVDIDRDRIVRDNEKVEGSNRMRLLELDAQIIKGDQVENLNRTVRIRRSMDESNFSVATVGGYLSTLQIDDKSIQVWRVDGNGNGLFSDPVDEIWMDANADGRWSQLAERHLYRSAIAIGQNRYAVRGDERGTSISFKPLVGEGTIVLESTFDDDVTVESFSAKLYGDDGSCHSVGSSQKLLLPIGKYTLGQFGMRVSKENQPSWTYSFSHSGAASNQRWFEIEKGESVSISLFGDLKLAFATPESILPGDVLKLTPQLLTDNNLFITSCWRGEIDEWGRAQSSQGSFEVSDGSGRKIGSATSGFA